MIKQPFQEEWVKKCQHYCFPSTFPVETEPLKRVRIARENGIYAHALRSECIPLWMIYKGALLTDEERSDITIHCSDTHCNHDVQFLMYHVTLSLAHGPIPCNINFCKRRNIT